MKYTSQLCFLSIFSLFSTLTIAGVNCKDNAKAFNATRADNRDILTTYIEKCPTVMKDARGFSLYDSAALHGRGELMKWLISQHQAKDGQYSPAMIKLIQTGLRYLDIDAGIINGKITSETKNAIKTYQKSIGQAPTGQISVSWLPSFYRQITKAVQSDLSLLGYNLGTADGIIGADTQKAMKSFREKHKVAVPDYPRIDDQLIYQLMLAQNEIRKQRLAKQQAEEKAAAIAKQKALEAKREQAKKEAERKRKEALAREEKARKAAERKAQAEADAEATRRQNALALERQKAQLQAIQQEKALYQNSLDRQIRQVEAQRQAQLAAQARQAEAQRQAQLAEQAREAEAQRQAQLAEQAREAEAQRQAQLAAQARQAEAQRQAQLAAQARQAEAQRQAQLAAQVKPTTSKHKARTGRKFNKLSGMLVFGGSPDNCTISGQQIEASWCQTYYPSGANKTCDAVISNTGMVVSLRCK